MDFHTHLKPVLFWCAAFILMNNLDIDPCIKLKSNQALSGSAEVPWGNSLAWSPYLLRMHAVRPSHCKQLHDQSLSQPEKGEAALEACTSSQGSDQGLGKL